MTYPLSILNELHEHYPILLYQPSLFETSNDVVQYILEQSIHRTHREELARYQAEQSQLEHSPESQQRSTQPAQVAQVAQVAQPAQVAQVAQVAQAAQVAQVAQVAQAAQVAQVAQVAQAARRIAVEEMERELYGTVISQEQMPLLEQLLTILFESNLSNTALASIRQTRHAPTIEQLEHSTTVDTLTEHQDSLCAICHEGMNIGHHIRHIHHCNHMFHQFCIDTWFSTHSTCPTCRHDIRSS